MATAVFRFAVVLFSLIGFTIFSLGSSLVPKPAGMSAGLAAIRLSSEAAAADIKIKRTPTALN